MPVQCSVLQVVLCLCWGSGKENSAFQLLHIWRSHPTALKSLKQDSLPLPQVLSKLLFLSCLSEDCCLFMDGNPPITHLPCWSSAESANFSSSRFQVPLVIQAQGIEPLWLSRPNFPPVGSLVLPPLHACNFLPPVVAPEHCFCPS